LDRQDLQSHPRATIRLTPLEAIGVHLAVVTSHAIQYHSPLFRELARNIDLTVFFAHRAKPADQAHAGFGVSFDWDVDLLSGYEHVFLHNVARNPSLDHFTGCDTPDLGRFLAEGSFDAVLVMGWHLKSFVQALLAAKRLGIPVMARGDSHLQTPRKGMKKLAKAVAYPGFLRLFDAALYVGERSRAYWIHYRYPSARLYFSPHCIDAEWFARHATIEARGDLRARLGIAADRKVALFAGKLVSHKRPLDLIAAASRVKFRGADIEVLVAGSGSLQSDIIAAAKGAGVSCHMLGFCNQSKMPIAYAAADALVLPSDHDTWGLVANEALACGKPIVVSNAAGCAPELAADGSAGRMYECGDVEALAQALNDVFVHPPTGEAIAARSARYSVAVAVEGILQATAFATRN
jgi:glycosyltransferase involved in cell wall biosynthesis